MSRATITWVAVSRWNFIISSILIVASSGQEDVPLQKAYEILNEATGILTIQQSPYAVQLSGLEARILRKLISNLDSIGLQAEPHGIANQIKNYEDRVLVAMVSNSNFKVRFKPKVDMKGDWLKPIRSITDVEGRKLGNVLNGFKERGLIVKTELL